MQYESHRGVESKQKEVLIRVRELLVSAETDVKKLREEARKEEEQNTAEYHKNTRGRVRKIAGRELGAKIELAAAEKATNWLSLTERGVNKERPLGRGYVYKEVLLDIAEGRIAPDELKSIVMSQEGTRGLHDYFEEGMKLSESILKYQDNPTIAMRAISYLYQDRRRVSDHEHVVEQTLSNLKKGERVVEGTDLDNVYIEYARVMVPKGKDSGYQEERLQMSVVVDYSDK